MEEGESNTEEWDAPSPSGLYALWVERGSESRPKREGERAHLPEMRFQLDKSG